jgi:hypothetical protein
MKAVVQVSIVAVVGFHMPMTSAGPRTAKFQLGIMTLLSMGVMLLMLVCLGCATQLVVAKERRLTRVGTICFTYCKHAFKSPGLYTC